MYISVISLILVEQRETGSQFGILMIYPIESRAMSATEIVIEGPHRAWLHEDYEANQHFSSATSSYTLDLLSR